MRNLVTSLLILALLSGCSDEEGSTTRDVTLTFAATIGDQPADCSTTYDALGSSGTNGQLADSRLFVSAVKVRRSDGDWVDVQLTDSDWQQEGVALLDFEDGSGACADSGSPEMNQALLGTVPEGKYDALSFQVGVPFELNHVDTATAPAPFNVPGMFWTWQGGFKFLKVDWLVAGGSIPRWNVHIGSTGCVSDAPTEAPAKDCGRPNLAQVELEPFNLDGDVVSLDLAALIANVDLTSDTTDTPPGCMSSPGEPADCGAVFDALGLDFDVGSCADGCSAQSVFAADDGG